MSIATPAGGLKCLSGEPRFRLLDSLIGREADHKNGLIPDVLREARVTIDLAVMVLFFGLDIVIVTAALFWLSWQRALKDPTDLRFRDRQRRRCG